MSQKIEHMVTTDVRTAYPTSENKHLNQSDFLRTKVFAVSHIAKVSFDSTYKLCIET
jgi:hypothetical protein